MVIIAAQVKRYGHIYNISSTHKKAEEDARLPRQNEHSRRPFCYQEEKEKRTEKTGCLKNTILQTLTRKCEFKNVFEQGRKFPSQYLILYIQNNGLDHSRLGFAVSRKVGNAVTRNRIKRRLREIFRKLLTEYDLCCDIVVVARSAAPEAEFLDLDRSIRRIFAGIKHENTVHCDHQAL
jgi:ribonuclease P protein component